MQLSHLQGWCTLVETYLPNTFGIQKVHDQKGTFHFNGNDDKDGQQRTLRTPLSAFHLLFLPQSFLKKRWPPTNKNKWRKKKEEEKKRWTGPTQCLWVGDFSRSKLSGGADTGLPSWIQAALQPSLSTPPLLSLHTELGHYIWFCTFCHSGQAFIP